MVEGSPRAYPIEALKHSGKIEEELGGNPIEPEYNAATDAVTVTAGGKEVHPARTWWTGWYEFHPETTLYEEGIR